MNDLEPSDPLVFSYMQASADLLRAALAQARDHDSEALDCIVQSVSQGVGMLQLTTTFAPSTGMASMAVTYLDDSGSSRLLMGCELQRKTHA